MRFVFIYTAAPNQGNIDIYVDGTKVTTLNQYKSSLQHQKNWYTYQKTWNSPTYSEGLHRAASPERSEGDTVQFINKATAAA